MNTEFYEQYAYFAEEPFNRPLNADHVVKLQQLLDNDALDETTELFVFEISDNHQYGIIATHLVFHEVAQGITDGQPWVVCFCPVCNSGSSFNPTINTTPLTFAAQGLHHAMVLMADDQTKSYWDHLSGKCLVGEHQGKQLERLGSVTSTTAQNAVAKYPNLKIILSQIQDDEQDGFNYMNNLRDNWDDDFKSLLIPSKEDDRLPRLTMGLGIWSDHNSKFYSYTKLNANNNMVFDTFADRNILVYLDPHANVPIALFTDAQSAHWHGDLLHLSNGDYIRDSVLYDKLRQPKPIDLPLQLFVRWYAFAFKFPKTAIY